MCAGHCSRQTVTCQVQFVKNVLCLLQVGATLIDIEPSLIDVGPAGAIAGAGGISVGPSLIDISPGGRSDTFIP